MRHVSIFASSLIPILAMLTACETAPGEGIAAMQPTPDSNVTLSGTVFYRERIALPTDARLVVRISDVSLMDVAAPVIAEIEIATEGRQVPLAFSLNYNAARIDPRGRYAVSESPRVADG